jgi:hypothetical protein
VIGIIGTLAVVIGGSVSSGQVSPSGTATPATGAELAIIERGLQPDVPRITASRIKRFMVKYRTGSSADACGLVNTRPELGDKGYQIVHLQMFLDDRGTWHAFAFSTDEASNRSSCDALEM